MLFFPRNEVPVIHEIIPQNEIWFVITCVILFVLNTYFELILVKLATSMTKITTDFFLFEMLLRYLKNASGLISNIYIRKFSRQLLGSITVRWRCTSHLTQLAIRQLLLAAVHRLEMAGNKQAKLRAKQGQNVHKKKTRNRWKKGHSSESNPAVKKHRLAAKNRFFNVNTGQFHLPRVFQWNQFLLCFCCER